MSSNLDYTIGTGGLSTTLEQLNASINMQIESSDAATSTLAMLRQLVEQQQARSDEERGRAATTMAQLDAILLTIRSQSQIMLGLVQPLAAAISGVQQAVQAVQAAQLAEVGVSSQQLASDALYAADNRRSAEAAQVAGYSVTEQLHVSRARERVPFFDSRGSIGIRGAIR